MPIEDLSSSPEGKVIIHSADHRSSATILLYGATVTSFVSSGKEKLFLSKKSALDGSSPVRGGIPVVFPVFGPPSDHEHNEGLEHAGRHGFARNRAWTVKSLKEDGEGGPQVVLTLSTTDHLDLQKAYQWPVEVAYTVTLSKDGRSLTSAFSVTHLSGGPPTPARFQALLHNYLLVPDATTAGVQGLKSLSYIDKEDSKKVKDESNDVVILNGQASDRVYKGGAPDVHLLYDGRSREGGGLQLTRSKEFKDTVVWNPSAEAKIGDLHEGGWKEYVCAEPGSVDGFIELEEGKTWTATQTLTVL